METTINFAGWQTIFFHLGIPYEKKSPSVRRTYLFMIQLFTIPRKQEELVHALLRYSSRSVGVTFPIEVIFVSVTLPKPISRERHFIESLTTTFSSAHPSPSSSSNLDGQHQHVLDSDAAQDTTVEYSKINGMPPPSIMSTLVTNTCQLRLRRNETHTPHGIQ